MSGWPAKCSIIAAAWGVAHQFEKVFNPGVERTPTPLRNSSVNVAHLPG